MKQKLSLHLLFLGCYILVNGHPAPMPMQNEKSVQNDKCAAIMNEVTKAESPFSHVGHALHSMTVRDLRLFDPLADTVNYIPTINRDTTSTQALLPHAPDIVTADDEMFLTDAMKTLNYQLSHMDEKNSDIIGYSTLEKIVHEFHMKEVWAHALTQFEKIKASPPSSSACQCVLDIKNNGILKFLRSTALEIREPALVYGGGLDSQSRTPQSRRYGFGLDVGYRFRWKKVDVDKSSDSSLLKEKEEAMPPLTDATAWKKWKEAGSTTEAADYNNAMFIYCAVQKAHQQS